MLPAVAGWQVRMTPSSRAGCQGMAIRLGIDFGTTRTVVAAQDNGNYPAYTFSWQGEAKEYIPTLVGVKDGILLFGWDAACLISHPGAFILRSMKRLADQLRPEDPVDLGPDCSIALLEVVTLFLNHVRQMILEHGNIPMEKMDALEVMVATPANANTNQRYLTLEGFRRAGFAVLGAMDALGRCCGVPPSVFAGFGADKFEAVCRCVRSGRRDF